jgi:hypothetical protein
MTGRGRLSISIGAFIIAALLTTACGGSKEANNGPKPLSGRILLAQDLPDMREHDTAQVVPDVNAFAEAGRGDLFKSPHAQIVRALTRDGFVRVALEQFNGPGTLAGALAAQFRSVSGATAGLKYMYSEALLPCPNEPVCRKQSLFTVPGIPGSDGQQVEPNRKQGKPLTRYNVLFRIGTVVYGVTIGGDPDYFDPGVVTKDAAFTLFKETYQRVKSESLSTLFAPTPQSS